MGETAAAGGVFMGLGLRGVRGSGVAEAVGVTEAPLEGGPKVREQRNKHIQVSVNDNCISSLVYKSSL